MFTLKPILQTTHTMYTSVAGCQGQRTRIISLPDMRAELASTTATCHMKLRFSKHATYKGLSQCYHKYLYRKLEYCTISCENKYSDSGLTRNCIEITLNAQSDYIASVYVLFGAVLNLHLFTFANLYASRRCDHYLCLTERANAKNSITTKGFAVCMVQLTNPTPLY